MYPTGFVWISITLIFFICLIINDFQTKTNYNYDEKTGDHYLLKLNNMKRIKYLLLACFAALFIITGCEKDDEETIINEDNITVSEEALSQIFVDPNDNKSFKNGDELFYMIWDFGPNGDVIKFHSKMLINVDNPASQILFSVTYYWDESASGTNKWKRIPNGAPLQLLDSEVVPGDEVYRVGTWLWDQGNVESFSCAIYQYDTSTGAIQLKNIEWKIDVVIDWLVW